jgi:hypothetical protein
LAYEAGELSGAHLGAAERAEVRIPRDPGRRSALMAGSIPL